MIKELTQDNFAETLANTDKVCVIDFWASWCIPCKKMDSVLESLTGQYDGKVKFFKVDVAKNGKLTTDLQIQSIPTILFYKDPEHTDIQRGTAKEEKIKEKIEALLG
jgi:thioredoxin 1